MVDHDRLRRPFPGVDASPAAGARRQDLRRDPAFGRPVVAVTPVPSIGAAPSPTRHEAKQATPTVSTSRRPGVRSSAVGRREPTTAVGAEVDHERQRYEEPLEPRHVMTRAPGPERGVRERRPRQQEEPEQGQDPAAERMAQDVAEDPQQEQDQPRGDQREQGEQEGHPPNITAAPPGGRHPNRMTSGARPAGTMRDQLTDRQERAIP